MSRNSRQQLADRVRARPTVQRQSQRFNRPKSIARQRAVAKLERPGKQNDPFWFAGILRIVCHVFVPTSVARRCCWIQKLHRMTVSNNRLHHAFLRNERRRLWRTRLRLLRLHLATGGGSSRCRGRYFPLTLREGRAGRAGQQNAEKRFFHSFLLRLAKAACSRSGFTPQL
jgi:hypothetical protein